MRLELIGFRLALLLAVGMLLWGAVGVVREHRETQAVTGAVDQAWVLEWLCIRRDECGTPPQSAIDSARITIDAERASRRVEHQALRGRFLLLTLLGPTVTLLIFYLLRWALMGRIKPLWVLSKP